MKNRDYWRRRFEILEASAINKGGNYLATLDREYRTAMMNVEAELSKWYQRFASDEFAGTIKRALCSSTAS